MTTEETARNKYKWNICIRCHLPYIPYKENQRYCSYWCEMLAEEESKGTVKMQIECESCESREPEIIHNADTLNVKAWFSYPEDSLVDGKDDDKNNPRMPFVKKADDYDMFYWDINIDIPSGRILNWPHGTTAKTFYKTSDMCELGYFGKRYEEYVPDFLQIFEDGYGDYIHIEILPDGTIKDWNPVKCIEWLKKNKNKFE